MIHVDWFERGHRQDMLLCKSKSVFLSQQSILLYFHYAYPVSSIALVP